MSCSYLTDVNSLLFPGEEILVRFSEQILARPGRCTVDRRCINIKCSVEQLSDPLSATKYLNISSHHGRSEELRIHDLHKQ